MAGPIGIEHDRAQIAKQFATRLLPLAMPPTRPRELEGMVHVAGRPVGAGFDIDFQRHGEVRGGGHFLGDERA